METRKVQRVGYSTLAVSLPKEWTAEVGLKRGDIITFKKEENGGLMLFPGVEPEERVPLKSVINADMCHEQDLLTRIITGSYILGCDTFQITSKKELRSEHLEEIRNTTRRLTGIGIVEQTLNQVTIQSFVDPNKFPVEGLIRRLHIIASSMQLTAIRALIDRRSELTTEVVRMEEEADRIYWLIVRQLLLAQRGEAKIGVERPGQIVGDRVIAKSIEEIADYAEDIAIEVTRIVNKDYSKWSKILEDLSQMNDLVQIILDKTMESLFRTDVKLANDVIETTKIAFEKERSLATEIVTKVNEVDVATSLRSVVWGLKQISRSAKVISEIVINRSLATPSETCKIEGI